MEKYYCDHCKLIYQQEELCKACGALAGKKIIIEVQMQNNPKNNNRLS